MKRSFYLPFVLSLPLAGQALAACPMFPADNVWNAPVAQLPVDPRSDAYIASIGASTGLHPDFGSGTWDGGPIGIPYNSVTGAQPKVPVAFKYADESDPGPYPIPHAPVLEYGSDHHLLVVNQENCVLYETWDTRQAADGSWQAGSGAIFDLRSNALRPAEWTSADAAGLPIFPGLARCEEVEAGSIDHALRFTAQRTQSKFVWPARHYASSIIDPNVPPMGQRFRLKASFDVSRYSPKTQIILNALKTYGMFLADNGSNWYLSGAPGACWNDEVLVNELRTVTGSAFEAVDESSLMVDANSGQIKTNAALVTLNVSRLGDGRGAIASTPPGIDCGTTCTARFQAGATVALNATPEIGSTFAGWGGACGGTTSPTTLVLNQDSLCTATFATAPSPALSADLTVTLTQSSSVVRRTQGLKYMLRILNQGPATTTSVKATVALPASFTFASASTGCIFADGIVSCALGTMASGASKTLAVQVKPTVKGSFSTSAQVTGATSDPNTSNNASTLTTVVR